MARGHDDDHRLRLVRRDQVVEDDAGPAQCRPRLVGVTRAVQQVEDGIAVAARSVSRRGVDVHAALASEHGGVVEHLGQRAVGHVLRVRHLRAGHDQQARVSRGRLVGGLVTRIGHLHALDDEAVLVRPRGQRADRRFPDTVFTLHHWKAAAANALDADVRCIGSEQSENDPLVRQHLRRYDDGARRGSTPGGCSGRRARYGGLRRSLTGRAGDRCGKHRGDQRTSSSQSQSRTTVHHVFLPYLL